MAACNALNGKPTSLEDSVLADSLDGVLRAGWGKAARWWFEWRDALLIEANQQNKREGHHSPDAI